MRPFSGNTRRACGAVIALFACLSASAGASPSARTAARLAPPRAGDWEMLAPGEVSEIKGTLTVTRAQYLTSVKGTIQSGAETACGEGTVVVQGRHRIFDARGEGAYGPYNEYVVGRSDPSADPVIQPIRVQLLVDGRAEKGTMEMVLSHRGEGLNGGSISYPGAAGSGGCELSFTARRL